MQFDQQYLDHLADVTRQATEIVNKTIPLYSGQRSPENYADRTALRQTALDNLLVDMLEQPQMVVFDPKAGGDAGRGQAEDVTLEDTGPR
jgi:hypothetical protein